MFARLTILLGLFACLLVPARADVVKPALIEISANVEGSVSVEIRASLEALLTGINARYQNTQEAPNAAEYDAFRVLEAEALREAFEAFVPTLLDELWLRGDDTAVALRLTSLDIPPPGYTKVPRISTLVLSGALPRETAALRFYYPARFGDSAVRVRQVDEGAERWHWSQWQWLRSDAPSAPFSLAELFHKRPAGQVLLDYTLIGFEHIIPLGLDHILFILGLFLFSPRLSPLIWQATMFTLAHTLTLGLSMAGYVDLPARVVEPLIALSIAWIAVENLRGSDLGRGRLAVVFGFGLLHGLGFAGVLQDFGMPREDFAIALLGFNIGVEVGQVAILLTGFVLLSRWAGSKTWYRSWVVVPGSLAIAAVGLYWTWERLAFS